MEFNIDDELMDMYKVFIIHGRWNIRRECMRPPLPVRLTTDLEQQQLKDYACHIDQDLWVDIVAMPIDEIVKFENEHNFNKWFNGMYKTYPGAFKEWCDALFEETKS